MTTVQFQLGGTLKFLVEEPESLNVRIGVRYDDGFTVIAKGDIMYTLGADHMVTMQVSYVDAAGNPAAVDGGVTWTASDDTLIRLDVDTADSTICMATPAGPVGQVQVTASADADLGSGVKTLVTNADIQIVAGEAVAGTIQPVGDPQPIAPHAEPRKK
jgi:hypothetical protein